MKELQAFISMIRPDGTQVAPNRFNGGVEQTSYLSDVRLCLNGGLCDTKTFFTCSATQSRVNANQSRPMQNICWSFLPGPIAIP